MSDDTGSDNAIAKRIINLAILKILEFQKVVA